MCAGDAGLCRGRKTYLPTRRSTRYQLRMVTWISAVLWRSPIMSDSPKDKFVERIAKILWGLDHDEWERCPCPDEWRKEARKLIRLIERRTSHG